MRRQFAPIGSGGTRVRRNDSDMLHGRGGAAQRPTRCAGGQDCHGALLWPNDGWQSLASARAAPQGLPARGDRNGRRRIRFADTLLDAASYGSGRVQISPASRRARPEHFQWPAPMQAELPDRDPKFEFLLGGSSQLSARDRELNGY